ncbi:hypothetical protein H9X96_03030 [Pedobacter sp. N36a]|uniref:hypothetical protein n=1 Tax=Pedobacter sp. N36a TaxID=2767996 RepID=UPI001656FFFE|nr:hypothetical protein [Pedobacter sp. N36a]MBC8984745.1 hypothetical protein [Pedobacter sp. N36a]
MEETLGEDYWCKKGTTKVHYIFEDVKLQKGKNKVAVVAGKTNLKDPVDWNLI